MSSLRFCAFSLIASIFFFASTFRFLASCASFFTLSKSSCTAGYTITTSSLASAGSLYATSASIILPRFGSWNLFAMQLRDVESDDESDSALFG